MHAEKNFHVRVLQKTRKGYACELKGTWESYNKERRNWRLGKVGKGRQRTRKGVVCGESYGDVTPPSQKGLEPSLFPEHAERSPRQGLCMADSLCLESSPDPRREHGSGLLFRVLPTTLSSERTSLTTTHEMSPLLSPSNVYCLIQLYFSS